MRLTVAVAGFVIFLLFVQGIQGQYGWSVTYNSTEICAPKGSAVVEIGCRYTYPSGWNNNNIEDKTFWFTKKDNGEYVDLKTDPEYSGRVEYSPHPNDCTLRITDLRQTDSAVYSFWFITNSLQYTGKHKVTLTVTELQVQVLAYIFTWLGCRSCDPPNYPSYIWYKNGEKIQAETSIYLSNPDPADSYSCALRGYEDFPSPSVCVKGDSCNRITYTDRNICVPRGSSVNISCIYNKYNYSDKSTFWFSSKGDHQTPSDLSEDSQYAGRVQVFETERGRSTLTISDLTDSDSAQYLFKFRTPNFEWRSLPGTTLTVTDLQVQVIRTSVHRSKPYAVLKCEVSCSSGGLSYAWFRNGQKIPRKAAEMYFLFNSKDVISCALKGHEDHRSPLVYAPGVPSVSVSPSAEIVEGSSVTLTCSSDANPPANYIWYKDEENPKPLSEEPQLVFSSIQSSDSGQYYCTADNKLGWMVSGYIPIDVKYAPKTSEVSVRPSAEIEEGSSVSLTCSSDANPAANYILYKENQKLLQGPEGRYHFAYISSEDSGVYHCESGNQYGSINSTSLFLDVQYAPKLPSVSVSLSEIVEGSSVNLTCSSDANPAANYTWYKQDEESPKASGQIFTITDFSSEYTGNYYCEAQNTRGRQNNAVHLTVWAGKSTEIMNIIMFTLVAVMPISLLLCFLWIRKKKAQSSITKANVKTEAFNAPTAGWSQEEESDWDHVNALPTDWGHVNALPTDWGHVNALPTDWGHVNALPTDWDHVNALPLTTFTAAQTEDTEEQSSLV